MKFKIMDDSQNKIKIGKIQFLSKSTFITITISLLTALIASLFIFASCTVKISTTYINAKYGVQKK